MEQLVQLIYVSSAVNLYSREDLVTLLTKAREANLSNNITGLLLYKDGNFMQVIEGTEEAINRLQMKLEQDRAHKDMIVLLKEPIEEREFSEWSMAFKDISGEQIEGFSDFFSVSPRNIVVGSEAKTLLLSFKKTC